MTDQAAEIKTTRKGFSNPLYVFYQSTSDELMFWPLFDVLFLSLAKGYSAAEISLVFTVSLWAGLALKPVIFQVLKKLRAGTSMIIGAVMFLLAAVFITFGPSIVVVIIGQTLYCQAFSFQEMSGVYLKNAQYKNGSKPDYIRLRALANGIYATISLISMIFLNTLCNITMYLPMYICIGACVNSVVLSILLYRYDNTDNRVQNTGMTPRMRYKKIDSAAVLCLILSAMAYVVMVLGMDNLRLFTETSLSELFDEEKVVFYFSMILIVNRIIKISGNLFAMAGTRKKKRAERDLMPVFITLISLVPVLGLIGCLAGGIGAVVFASVGYFACVFVYDPFGARLTKMLMEYISPESMKRLMFLNSTMRDISQALVSALVTLILTTSGMLGVMILLSVVGIALGIFYLISKKNLARKVNNQIFLKWTKDDTENTDSLIISAAVLLCYNNIEASLKFSPRELGARIPSAEKISDRYPNVQFSAVEAFNEDALRAHFSEGELCAVHYRLNGEYTWLPVLLIDEGGMMLFDLEEKWVFADRDPAIDQIAVFKVTN